jgi:uncharacterized protein YaeQ
MALGATVYKATLEISDLDRGYYEHHVLTVARHPSETEERLMLRVLAFCRFAGERLQFGDGLSEEGEPALWEIADTGDIVTWVELGIPALKQVRRAAGKSEHVVILAYDEARIGPWWESNGSDFAKIDKLSVIAVSDAQAEKLARLAARNMKLAVTIQDGVAWVSDEHDSVQVDFRTILSERSRR